ncbi:hypothetical protein Bhyg_01023 [Pseudolycoriella hygida]|uniref:Uncharacterized protein n=1 Tax=Pseudolycoriella hygida TaxID=35572 RepID=A0A9Q0NAL6_9DIPT|nr:hypothetical protein Bhyg_01023 [Pseudolycoriella hygida]
MNGSRRLSTRTFSRDNEHRRRRPAEIKTTRVEIVGLNNRMKELEQKLVQFTFENVELPVRLNAREIPDAAGAESRKKKRPPGEIR